MKRPLGAVALCTALILMAWLAWAGEPSGADAAFEDGQQLYLTGRVYDVQIKQFGTERLWIYLDEIGLDSKARTENLEISQTISASASETDISYKMICITESVVRPPIGSLICVSGQFETISHVTNPGQFDYKIYYDSIGIGARLINAQILAVSEEYSVLREALYCLRTKWRERLYMIYPETEASVLTAMLLGDKAGLSSEIKESYQENGIIHILSISGLHITLLGMSVYRLLRRGGSPVWMAALLGGILLILYGILTGMGISAVRAISMYLIRMLGEILGRTYDMLTALGFAALIMLAARPQYLNNSGFLLSFGSICGIGLLYPTLTEKVSGNLRKELAERKRLGSRLEKLPWILAGSVWNAMLPGLSITLFTLPIQLRFFYEIPLYSVCINLMVVPLVSVVMLSGMAVMLIPWVSWLSIVDIVILQWYELLCQWFSDLPFHNWNPGAPKVWQVIVYYLLLAGIILWKSHGEHKKTEQVRRVGRIGMMLAAVLVIGVRMPQALKITFLDVGQGDCVILQTKEEVYLFDCGSSSEKNVYEEILLPFLQYEGIQRLDGVFVSHPDSDHISGILELLEDGEKRIEVCRLILAAIDPGRREEEFEEVLNAADMGTAHDVPVSYMGKGTVWDSGNIRFQCLHPTEGSEIRDSNAYSQCFLVQYGRFSMLLTGDVEGMGERELIQVLRQEEIRDISLLKVAHHGSAYSTPEALLDQLQPLIAVISCGTDNAYGHPHAELLERLEDVGSKIMSTAEYGAVTVKVRSGVMKVSGFVK